MGTKPLKTLFVTLATRDYVEQAKQVFSSAYFKGGWRGDFMLLGVGLTQEDTGWFVRKGIIVKPCDLIMEDGCSYFTAVCSAKYLLFKEEFKQWDSVVFSDVDVIIEGSLDDLAGRKGFSACSLSYFAPFFALLMNRGMINENLNQGLAQKIQSLKKVISMYRRAFCTGVFAFSTDVIRKETYGDMVNLYRAYNDCTMYVDMLVLNIHFSGQWNKMSPIYNVFFDTIQERHPVLKRRPRGIVFHFPSADKKDKPWSLEHPYYSEWSENLRKADLIDLEVRQPGVLHKWRDRFYCALMWRVLNFDVLLHAFKNFARMRAVFFINDKFHGLYDAVRKAAGKR